MFETIKCQSCGATIEIDTNASLLACEYCGTKIYNKLMSEKESKKDDILSSVKNLLIRADNFELGGDIANARVYYNRVLDIDPGNVEAIAGDRRARGIVDFDNVCICFPNAPIKSVVYVQIDEGEAVALRGGKEALFSCDVGRHKMLFFTVMSSECSIEFDITNAFNEKRIAIDKSIFGLHATARDV